MIPVSLRTTTGMGRTFNFWTPSTIASPLGPSLLSQPLHLGTSLMNLSGDSFPRRATPASVGAHSHPHVQSTYSVGGPPPPHRSPAFLRFCDRSGEYGVEVRGGGFPPTPPAYSRTKGSESKSALDVPPILLNPKDIS
ncbi:hypothetical protein MSAN_01413400 [Mycena sanguinolenta]|uniref:Uncharacterized protein n=1 Tax=Mycena sanguinolenta TaxID=230812 RepID=A0A8H6YAV2_9AGAR|nr:hypothetical protein MSAN_01413400 [Mycena sanguinolenta]